MSREIEYILNLYDLFEKGDIWCLADNYVHRNGLSGSWQIIDLQEIRL